MADHHIPDTAFLRGYILSRKAVLRRISDGVLWTYISTVIHRCILLSVLARMTTVFRLFHVGPCSSRQEHVCRNEWLIKH